MSQKILVTSKEAAVALIAAVGGYEGSNDPAPVLKGHMEGDGEGAHWVEGKDQVRFRGQPVWQFGITISQISPINEGVRPDSLRIQFPSKERPRFADLVPSDANEAKTFI